MIRYTVVNVIQGQGIDAGVPVEVNWYKGTDKAAAIGALVQSVNHGDDQGTTLPESMRFRVLSVRLDTEVIPDPEPLSWRADWDEDGRFALDDCCWWDNQYQAWARVDCSGRMALLSMTVGGDVQAQAPICEGHYNAYPDSLD